LFRALARWWRRRRGAAPAGATPAATVDGHVVPVPEFDGRVEAHVSPARTWIDRSSGRDVERVVPAHAVAFVHVDRPCRPAVAAPGQRPRCSETPPGDFYTDCETCLLCDQFAIEAPDLVAYVRHPQRDEHATGPSHCAFVRQPRTAAEIERAIDAMCGSEVCGIRYGGRDPEILRRIADRGWKSDGTADHPLG
jgi:hypothetical protein